MFARLGTFFAGLLGLVAAALLSYVYLEQTVGPRDISQVQVATSTKKEVSKQATSSSVAGKQAATKVSVPVKANGSLVPKETAAQKTVVAPGPLRASATTKTTSSLTVQGVIAYTNKERALNGGLPALVENSLLDQDATIKLNDLFTKQYFEHVSPSGVGPADLAKLVGYEFVIVGENLALGDFAGDQGVVTAWMNSPGHRANILNTHYREIGVAVGKGMYEGRETWIAVQAFGTPLVVCPVIDLKLKAKIEENNATIASLRAQLDAKKIEIDAMPPDDPRYNTLVNEFNTLVPQYNNLVETNRFNVTTYNSGVRAFNLCIGEISGGATN